MARALRARLSVPEPTWVGPMPIRSSGTRGVIASSAEGDSVVSRTLGRVITRSSARASGGDDAGRWVHVR